MSDAYDLTATGFGHYNVKPRNRFFVVNPATKRVTMVQAGTTHGTSVEWSSRLVARDDSTNHTTERILDITITKSLFGKVSSSERKVLEDTNQMVADHVADAIKLVVCVFCE